MITKTKLESMSAHELVKGIDFGEYIFGKFKTGIACIETIEREYCLSRKEQIVDAVDLLKEKEGYDCILVCIINPIEETNITIVAGETEEDMIHRVFDTTTDECIADLGNRILCKTQLLPPLEKRLK